MPDVGHRPVGSAPKALQVDATVYWIAHLTQRNPSRLVGAQHLANHTGIVRDPQLTARNAERRPADK